MPFHNLKVITTLGISTVLSLKTKSSVSVGFNKDYIIAKQHPNDNRNTTNYFIVPVNPKKRVWGNYFGTIGPLTLNQFNDKIAELHIDNIKFSITEKSLE